MGMHITWIKGDEICRVMDQKSLIRAKHTTHGAMKTEDVVQRAPSHVNGSCILLRIFNTAMYEGLYCDICAKRYTKICSSTVWCISALPTCVDYPILVFCVLLCVPAALEEVYAIK